MLAGLDDIPWVELSHAYGSAEDVPELLRRLAITPASKDYETDPAYLLFGSIAHQGTIYEATSYAVPFLIEIATSASTPNRLGTLQLLSLIAEGTRPTNLHFDQQVAKATHAALDQGFETLVAIARDDSTSLQLAAAHVLARLPTRKKEVAALLRDNLARSQQYSAYLWLLGQTDDQSQQTLDLAISTLAFKPIAIRRATAFCLSRFPQHDIPPDGQVAILEAFLDQGILDHFKRLPWDNVERELDAEVEILIAALDDEHRAQAVDRLIEGMQRTDQAPHNETMSLLRLLFTGISPTPPYKPPPLRHADLSRDQLRAVQAMSSAMRSKQRIMYGSFADWGLPESLREFHDLAAGRETPPVDDSRPRLALADKPGVLMSLAECVAGARVICRFYGPGTIVKTKPDPDGMTMVSIDFDEEWPATYGFYPGELRR